MAANLDPDMLTTPFQFTKTIHRDVYPAIEPSKHAPLAAGKVVLIAGGAGGIGFITARTWAHNNAKGIVLVGRDEQKLQDAASELKSDKVLVAAGDIIKEDDVKPIFEKAIGRFGAVDVVVNTAGYRSEGAIGEVPPSEWWKDHEINVKGTYNLAHYLTNNSQGKLTTFINLFGFGAFGTRPRMSSLATSQLAAIKLGEHLDLELPNVRVFSIHPGIVQPSNGRGILSDVLTPFAKDKQELTAAVILYLLKDTADYARGGFLSVNWDVEEMEAHAAEIKEEKLLKLNFFKAKLGPGGHPWAQ